MRDILLAVSERQCLACVGEAGPWKGRLCACCADEIPTVLSRIGVKAGVQGWSLGSYAGAIGALVRRGKYGGDEGGLRLLGATLADAFAHARGIGIEQFQPDLVVPAPSSFWRSLKRGFDPVYLLARPVSRAIGLPLKTLIWRWGGAAQASLSPVDRQKNLRGRVHVWGKMPVNARVLVVDDILTTGATALACQDVLLGAGALEVRFLVAGSSL
jgi:ComF family protein